MPNSAYSGVRNRYRTDTELFPQQDPKPGEEEVPRHLRDQREGNAATGATQTQVVSEIVLRRINPRAKRIEIDEMA